MVALCVPVGPVGNRLSDVRVDVGSGANSGEDVVPAGTASVVEVDMLAMAISSRAEFPVVFEAEVPPFSSVVQCGFQIANFHGPEDG